MSIRSVVRAAVPLAALVALVTLGGCTSGSAGRGTEESLPTPSPSSAAVTPSDTPSVSASASEGDLSDPDPELDGSPLQLRPVTEAGVVSADVDCTAEPVPAVETPAGESLVACDPMGRAYALGPAVSEGGVLSATSALVEDTATWAVTVELGPEAAAALEELTTEIAGTGEQIAMLQGGRVLVAPSVQSPIAGGTLQIAGSYSETYATALATSLEEGG